MTRHLRGFAASARRRARFMTATCRRDRGRRRHHRAFRQARSPRAGWGRLGPAEMSPGEEQGAPRAPVVLLQRIDLTLHQPLLACMRRRCIFRCAACLRGARRCIGTGIPQACTRITRPASRRAAPAPREAIRARVAGPSRRARRRASAPSSSRPLDAPANCHSPRKKAFEAHHSSRDSRLTHRRSIVAAARSPGPHRASPRPRHALATPSPPANFRRRFCAQTMKPSTEDGENFRLRPDSFSGERWTDGHAPG